MSFDLSEYEHQGVEGEGAFALIRRFRHKPTGTLIAVKSLRAQYQNSADYRARLRREIELLESLRGVDGVIECLGHSNDMNDSSLWYAMPLAEVNLHEYIKANNSSLTEDARVTVYRRVLRAVRVAHERGVLHRDICPSNVLLMQKENPLSVVVSDFGLGRDMNSESDRTRSSADNYGHAYYVAPEQRDSLKQATAQSDVYSLGKLLNFVMTGKDPDHHYQCAFSAVIQRATQPDPVDRHPTVTHLDEHFDRMLIIRAEPATGSRILGISVGDSASPEQWYQVHEALINPKYNGHVYYGFIEPVVEFFSSDDRLREYCKATGSGTVQFVDTFIREVQSCMGTVGWPFSATKGFAVFFKRVFEASTDDQCRGKCLVGMWMIAYGADQWDAQRSLLALLRSSKVGDNESMILADFILEEDQPVRDDRLFNSAVPASIRNAAQHAGTTG